jgi:hypothetical protein
MQQIFMPVRHECAHRRRESMADFASPRLANTSVTSSVHPPLAHANGVRLNPPIGGLRHAYCSFV